MDWLVKAPLVIVVAVLALAAVPGLSSGARRRLGWAVLSVIGVAAVGLGIAAARLEPLDCERTPDAQGCPPAAGTPAFDAAWQTVGAVDEGEPDRCDLSDEATSLLAAGMTSDAVIESLGDVRMMTADESSIRYELGLCDYSIDDWTLVIALDDGRVTDWRVEQG